MIVINLIIINLHSSQNKYCITGDKLTSGATSAGVIAIYCGDCLGARIWPTGDGECRRY